MEDPYASSAKEGATPRDSASYGDQRLEGSKRRPFSDSPMRTSSGSGPGHYRMQRRVSNAWRQARCPWSSSMIGSARLRCYIWVAPIEGGNDEKVRPLLNARRDHSGHLGGPADHQDQFPSGWMTERGGCGNNTLRLSRGGRHSTPPPVVIHRKLGLPPFDGN